MRQWHFHHPFWGSALVMGGARLIGSMVWFGWKLRHDHSRLLRGRRTDASGIVLVQALMFSLALWQGELLKPLLLFVVERVVGAVVKGRRPHWIRPGATLRSPDRPAESHPDAPPHGCRWDW